MYLELKKKHVFAKHAIIRKYLVERMIRIKSINVYYLDSNNRCEEYLKTKFSLHKAVPTSKGLFEECVKLSRANKNRMFSMQVTEVGVGSYYFFNSGKEVPNDH